MAIIIVNGPIAPYINIYQYSFCLLWLLLHFILTKIIICIHNYYLLLSLLVEAALVFILLFLLVICMFLFCLFHYFNPTKDHVYFLMFMLMQQFGLKLYAGRKMMEII